MFERYTESARRALFFTRYEASQVGGTSLEPEHLLLGLLRDARSIHRALIEAHVSVDALRHEIETRCKRPERVSTSVEMPFTDATKRALEFAAEEADRLGHSYIGQEHLLLGLLREQESIAASVLAAHGLQLESVRSDLVRRLAEAGSATSSIEANTAARIEQIKTLVNELSVSAGRPDAADLVQRIHHELDLLKRAHGDHVIGFGFDFE